MRETQVLVLILAFLASSVMPPHAQAEEVLRLPVPGSMLALSQPYMPVTVKGLILHPQAPFLFDFLIDSGDTQLNSEGLKAESMKLIKYFLAALTVPEEEMWVNLSPYEKDRIVPDSFGGTAMGRDLLAQDYILKQLAASLTYPEKEMGKAFWDKVYSQAQARFGSSDIPVNTFNKVWIVPAKAAVYEHGNGVFVVENKLKVMLEQDYLAVEKNRSQSGDMLRKPGGKATQRNVPNALASQIIREIIIPALEKEVNEGEHFANLRQVYQTVILASWYKIRLKESILGKLYVDKHKTAGVSLTTSEKQDNEKIYQQYLTAFKKGVYNYIKEDPLAAGQGVVARKYVSGGATVVGVTAQLRDSLTKAPDLAMVGAAMQLHGNMFQIKWQGENTDKAMMVVQDRVGFGGDKMYHVSKVQDVIKAMLMKLETTVQASYQFNDIFSGVEQRRIMEGLIAEPDFNSAVKVLDFNGNKFISRRSFPALTQWLHGKQEMLLKSQRTAPINGHAYLVSEGVGVIEHMIKTLGRPGIDPTLVYVNLQGIFRMQGDIAEDIVNELKASVEPDPVETCAQRMIGWLEQRKEGLVNASASPDSAMLAPGGIDLNAKNLDVHIKRDGSTGLTTREKGMPSPVQFQNLDRIKIDGLYPVILNIMPLSPSSIPDLLGLEFLFEGVGVEAQVS